MLKKALVMTVFTFALLVFNGCSTEQSSSDGEGDFAGELTVWTHPFVHSDLSSEQNAVFHQMVEEFNEEYPDVTIKFEEIPWANREQKILTALAANQGPDIFYLIPDMMAQFADKGVLTPISDLIDIDKEDFPESSLESVTYDEQLFGLPILHEVQVQIYNTSILEEVGGDQDSLPATWDEFDELARAAVEKGYFASTFEGGNTPNSTLYPYIWQAGGDIIDEGGNVVVNSEQSLRAFERINEMYQNDWIPKDSINAESHFDAFLEGRVFSSRGTGLAVTMLKEQGFDDYIIGPPLQDDATATFGATGMFVVPSNSDNKQAAAEFIAYMTNTNNSKAFNELTNYIPPRKSAAEIYDDNLEMKQMTEYLQYVRPGVIHPVARDIIPQVQAEMQAMMEGSKTPQEAADDLAAGIAEEIEK